MEQFDLSLWLQNKSRKVVTRDGRPVRILDYNLKGDKRICIAIDDKTQESITTVDEDGHCLRDKTGWHESNFDLFFTDEEKELTEFENKLADLLIYNHPMDIESAKSIVKRKSKQLLDLARKEIENENSEFKPKFTYNEKDYSKLANKLIEFRNNTPLCSVSYRDGEARDVILHYEKEIIDLVKGNLERLAEVEESTITRKTNNVCQKFLMFTTMDILFI